VGTWKKPPVPYLKSLIVKSIVEAVPPPNLRVVTGKFYDPTTYLLCVVKTKVLSFSIEAVKSCESPT